LLEEFSVMQLHLGLGGCQTVTGLRWLHSSRSGCSHVFQWIWQK